MHRGVSNRFQTGVLKNYIQTQKTTVMSKQLIWLLFIHKPDHYVLHCTRWFYLVTEFLYTSGTHPCQPEKQLDSNNMSPIAWTMSSQHISYISLSQKDLSSKKNIFQQLELLSVFFLPHFNIQRDDVGIILLAGSGL